MTYEETNIKPLTPQRDREIMRKAYKQAVLKQNSAYTLWLLAIKHRVPLLTIGNVVLMLNWAFPEWTQLVKALAHFN